MLLAPAWPPVRPVRPLAKLAWSSWGDDGVPPGILFSPILVLPPSARRSGPSGLTLLARVHIHTPSISQVPTEWACRSVSASGCDLVVRQYYNVPSDATADTSLAHHSCPPSRAVGGARVRQCTPGLRIPTRDPCYLGRRAQNLIVWPRNAHHMPEPDWLPSHDADSST